MAHLEKAKPWMLAQMNGHRADAAYGKSKFHALWRQK